jgi:hypothetical protein
MPTAAGRVSKTLGRALADGSYLTAWREVGALAPPVLLAVGFVVGWTHPTILGWGFLDTPPVVTESLAFLIVAAMVGAAGAGLGLALTVGYALGNVLSLHPNNGPGPPGSAAGWLGLLLSYVLLGQLTTMMPLLASVMREATSLRFLPSGRPRLVMAAGLAGGLYALVAYLWAIAATILVRPAFTWQGTTPPTEAVVHVQQAGGWIALFAGLAGVGRAVAEGHAAIVTPRQQSERASASVGWPPVTPWLRLSVVVRAPVAGVLATVLIAGALDRWLDAILIAAFFTLMYLARRGKRALLPLVWVDTVERIPVLLRLAVAAIAASLVSRAVVGRLWLVTSTFRPVVIAVALSLVVVYLLCPSFASRPKDAK